MHSGYYAARIVHVETRLPLSRPGRPDRGHGAAARREHAAARELFERAKAILGYDLLAVCLEGPAEKLDSTVYSQPALFVTSLAALEWLKANKPDVVSGCQAAAGLSLGEYTALVFAGVMSFEDGLRVVQERGRAMQDAADAVPSGMVSILGWMRDKIEKLCSEARAEGEVLQIANLLVPRQHRRFGPQDGLRARRRPGDQSRRDEDDSAGGGRRVPHAAHAAGGRAAGQGAGRREAEQAANSGDFERRCRRRTTIRKKSATCSCSRSFRRCAGKIRMRKLLAARPRRRSGKSARAACCGDC